MTDTDRDHLVENIVGHASDDVARETQLRVIAYWSAVDPGLGSRVATGLGIDIDSLNGEFSAAKKIVEEHAGRA